MTFIDTAESYRGNPECVGSTTRRGTGIQARPGDNRHKVRAPQNTCHRRPALRITWGSFGNSTSSRRKPEKTQTDYIDLYQYHRFDPETPLEETVSTLAELVREGKIPYFGHTAFHGWQIAEAQNLARLHGGNGFVSGSYRWNSDRTLGRNRHCSNSGPLWSWHISLLPARAGSADRKKISPDDTQRVATGNDNRDGHR
ncbi:MULTISPECIES: aldo/keto reductase family protein [unclassified Arthrobacter]|uniref:aldo/keto reductase family protein n=1 Tax=unclassified Arthrobacter TaxID=235627 RepID=UPI0035B358EF